MKRIIALCFVMLLLVACDKTAENYTPQNEQSKPSDISQIETMLNNGTVSPTVTDVTTSEVFVPSVYMTTDISSEVVIENVFLSTTAISLCFPD